MSRIELQQTADQLAVERAATEMRAGRAVLVRDGHLSALVMCAEALGVLDGARLEALETAARPSFARLVLPGPRLHHLGASHGRAGLLALPQIDLARIETLVFETGARLDAPVSLLAKLDEAALELARIAMVMPALLVVPMRLKSAGNDILRVSTVAILSHRASKARDMRIVGRAAVPLEGAPQTEFVIFRGGEGLRDQVAIIVGQPDFGRPVTVRLHSACLTGDLFGSLKCDCGDQLRQTVRHMAEAGGGILLYLDQEGRGNGLSNKIRAYSLQAQGYDTYEADAILGFAHDQRRFDFAAVMLAQLGVTQVDILTNNPDKIAALQAAGLDVVSHRRIHGRATDQNLRYLATKRDRAGHYLDADLQAPARAQD